MSIDILLEVLKVNNYIIILIYILQFYQSERGARFALLKVSNEEKRKGVIAASAGNHALVLWQL